MWDICKNLCYCVAISETIFMSWLYLKPFYMWIYVKLCYVWLYLKQYYVWLYLKPFYMWIYVKLCVAISETILMSGYI